MPRKGMRSVFFHASPSRTPPQLPRPRPLPTTDSIPISENLTRADSLITKWDLEGSTYAKITSLFHESRDEARLFLKVVSNLNRSMYFFLASPSSRHDLVRAHRLMDTAMKRLQKEFFQILSVNRDRLDSDSLTSTRTSFSEATTDDDELYHSGVVSEIEEIKYAGETFGEVERLPVAAMADLKAIAEVMVSCGYAKECVNVYKLIRKSIVDERIYCLGFQKISSSLVQKLDWESTEHRIITWLSAADIVVKTLFHRERILCDYIFGSSTSYIKESCFAEITKEAAFHFLEFPELITNAKTMSSSKKSPEKRIRHLLDLYISITNLFPEIESIFSYDSTLTVRSQALISFQKVVDSVHSWFSDFESRIQNDSSKGIVQGGGIHPLTKHVIDYLILLSDYEVALTEIFVGKGGRIPSPPDEKTAVSAKLSWLLFVLLSKLNAKADLYKELALSYLFLANNLHYMTCKVKETANLLNLVGQDWVETHQQKATSFTGSYEKLTWGNVTTALETEDFGQFNSAFREACEAQASWVVVDRVKMRQEILTSVKKKVLIPYMVLYNKRTVGMRERDDLVSFAPQDVEKYLDGLFRECGGMDVLSWSLSGFGSDYSSRSGSSERGFRLKNIIKHNNK